MPGLIEHTTVTRAGGNKPRRIEASAGRVAPGERVRYSTPDPAGAECVAIRFPALSPDTVHRDGKA